MNDLLLTWPISYDLLKIRLFLISINTGSNLDDRVSGRKGGRGRSRL